MKIYGLNGYVKYYICKFRNFITIKILQILNNNNKKNEIIIPSLTWVSDVNSVIMNGFKPVFVDINLSNLSNEFRRFKKINEFLLLMQRL